MKSENTLSIGVRIDSAQWLVMQDHAVRCAACAAISSVWAPYGDSGAHSRHRVIDAQVRWCRGAERRGGPVARVRSERS